MRRPKGSKSSIDRPARLLPRLNLRLNQAELYAYRQIKEHNSLWVSTLSGSQIVPDLDFAYKNGQFYLRTQVANASLLELLKLLVKGVNNALKLTSLSQPLTDKYNIADTLWNLIFIHVLSDDSTPHIYQVLSNLILTYTRDQKKFEFRLLCNGNCIWSWRQGRMPHYCAFSRIHSETAQYQVVTLTGRVKFFENKIIPRIKGKSQTEFLIN